MADKNAHNLAAARKEGRKEFANETRMQIESMRNNGAPDEIILEAVEAKLTEEIAA